MLLMASGLAAEDEARACIPSCSQPPQPPSKTNLLLGVISSSIYINRLMVCDRSQSSALDINLPINCVAYCPAHWNIDTPSNNTYTNRLIPRDALLYPFSHNTARDFYSSRSVRPVWSQFTFLLGQHLQAHHNDLLATQYHLYYRHNKCLYTKQMHSIKHIHHANLHTTLLDWQIDANWNRPTHELR